MSAAIPSVTGTSGTLTATHSFRRRTWLGVPALALLATSAAQAQMGGMGGMGGMSGRGGPPPGNRPGAGGDCAPREGAGRALTPTLSTVKSLIDERLNALPAELGLDPDVQPMFERYAKAVRLLTNDELKRVQRAPRPARDALSMLAEQVDDASNRLTAWEPVMHSAKALLQQLDPAQRAIANRRLIVSIDPRHWLDKPGA